VSAMDTLGRSVQTDQGAHPAVSRSIRRGALAAAVAVMTCTVLSGCASGFSAETTQIKDVAEGANGSVGDINLRNMLLVTSEDQSTAGVVGAIVNHGSAEDSLTAVTVDGVSATGGLPAPVEPNQLLILGSQKGQVQVTVSDIKSKPGDMANVVLKFRDAGDVSLQVLVEPPVEGYKSWAPSPSPSPSASVSPSP
jgi:hypothetical protein